MGEAIGEWVWCGWNSLQVATDCVCVGLLANMGDVGKVGQSQSSTALPNELREALLPPNYSQAPRRLCNNKTTYLDDYALPVIIFRMPTWNQRQSIKIPVGS